MKKILIYSFICLLLISSSSFSQEASGEADDIMFFPLNIEQVMQIMIANSLDIQIAKFDIYRSRTQMDAAESIFDTVLTASANYSDDQRRPTLDTLGTKNREKSLSLDLTKNTLLNQYWNGEL